MRLIEPALVPKPWETAFWKWGPGPHLLWCGELDCRDGTPYPERWRRSRAYPLSVEFEHVRATAGGYPLKVGSGYRTEAWNRKVDGSRHSQHPEGRAIDIYPSLEVRLPALVEAVLLVAHRPGGRIRGIGVYRTFVHIDIRAGDRVCRWRGSRVDAEVWLQVAEA